MFKNSKQVVPFYAWAVLALLWVVGLLNYFDRNLINSMRDPIVADFALTETQFGLLSSAFLWIYGILSPFCGYFADKYSKKMVIMISLFVWSLVTVWTGLASSFTEIIFARALMGISEACYIPAALALIADYHKGPTRSLATGLHTSGIYAGLILGGLGGYIAEWKSWRWGFIVFGIFGILYSIILLVFLKDSKSKSSENTSENITAQKATISISGSIKELFNERSFSILLFYFCIIGMVNWLIYSWLPTFLKDQFHLNLGEAGISATGYIQVASFAGVIIGGIIADRWSRKNIRGRLFVPIIGFTVGAPFLFLMSSTQIFGIAIIGMVVFGLARGFHDSNIMPILCQVIDNRYRATGYGFLNSLSTIAGGFLVYIGGALRDANVNLSLVFQITAIVLLLSTWSLLGMKLKKDT
jgi:MFS transporter, Spinster family, sphingosine-1-phosphate transporter